VVFEPITGNPRESPISVQPSSAGGTSVAPAVLAAAANFAI
jgi:hypothetical protein